MLISWIQAVAFTVVNRWLVIVCTDAGLWQATRTEQASVGVLYLKGGVECDNIIMDAQLKKWLVFAQKRMLVTVVACWPIFYEQLYASEVESVLYYLCLQVSRT
jgi:hypothetical protein